MLILYNIWLDENRGKAFGKKTEMAVVFNFSFANARGCFSSGLTSHFPVGD